MGSEKPGAHTQQKLTQVTLLYHLCKRIQLNECDDLMFIARLISTHLDLETLT